MTRRPTVARRARAAMTAVAAISVLVAVGLFVAVWARYTVAERGDELQRQAVAIAGGLEAEGVPDSELRERFFRVEARLIGAALAVTDEAGTVEYSTTGRTGAVYPVDDLGEPDADGVRRGVPNVEGAGRVLVVAVPLDAGGWLIVAQPFGEVRAAASGAILIAGLSVLVALPVAWLAGGWLARRLTGPIVRLRDAAGAVAEGEWGRTVLVEGDDEVAALARTFNRMSARVSGAYAAQKEFTGDVSHELRTPVTSIRGFAEALADGVVSEPDEVRRYAGTIRDEAVRLGELTGALLALADLDAGVVELARRPVDTAGLIEALEARFAASAGERGIELSIAATDATRPLGDEARLLQAATTLVDNALRYAPASGRVRVSMGSSERVWRLVVDDTGPGVPAERREEVFERFARLDRSRSTAGGGSGLGLSLCHKLVTLMDGRVWVEDGPLGGARFVVELPLAP